METEGLHSEIHQADEIVIFAIVTGEPETVYMDGRTPLKDVNTLCVEDRTDDEVILRRVFRSATMEDIQNATLKEPKDLKEEVTHSTRCVKMSST